LDAIYQELSKKGWCEMSRCHVIGCSKPAAQSGFFGALLKKIGCPDDLSHRAYASVFDGACAEHAGDAARRQAARDGIELRDEPKPTRKAGTPARSKAAPEPVKHFPTGHDARVIRLFEIEESLRTPARDTITDREPPRLTKPGQAGGGADQKARLWRWLISKGEKPGRLGNW
jgi:hypothetical protein